MARLGQVHFRRTWYTHGGVNHGKAIMTPPFPNNHALRVWEGPLDVSDLSKLLLVRNAVITAAGRLSAPTLALAAKLRILRNYTPVVDNNSEVPVELSPQVYFQYTHMDICECSQCVAKLQKTSSQ